MPRFGFWGSDGSCPESGTSLLPVLNSSGDTRRPRLTDKCSVDAYGAIDAQQRQHPHRSL